MEGPKVELRSQWEERNVKSSILDAQMGANTLRGTGYPEVVLIRPAGCKSNSGKYRILILREKILGKRKRQSRKREKNWATPSLKPTPHKSADMCGGKYWTGNQSPLISSSIVLKIP